MITTYLLQTHLDPNGWQNPLNEIKSHLDWQEDQLEQLEALLLTLHLWIKPKSKDVDADLIAYAQIRALEGILEEAIIQQNKIKEMLNALSVQPIESHHESQAEKRFGEKTDTTAKGQGAL